MSLNAHTLLPFDICGIIIVNIDGCKLKLTLTALCFQHEASIHYYDDEEFSQVIKPQNERKIVHLYVHQNKKKKEVREGNKQTNIHQILKLTKEKKNTGN